MRNIKTNFFYNALLTGINLLFPLLSFQYTLHVLGPVGIGKTAFVLSFAQYFSIIAAFGIPIYGIREVAKCKNDSEKLSTLFSELVIINIITGFILLLAYLIIIYSFGYFRTDQNLYLVGSLMIVFGFSSVDWLYTGLSDFRALTLRSFVVKSISLILLYIFIRSPADYYYYFLLTVGSILAINFINFVLIKNKVELKLTGLNLKRHINPLLLIFGIGIGASMYTVLDTVFLGFLTYPKIVGLYTCAIKFCKIFMPFISVIGVVLMPEISKKITKDNLTKAHVLLEKSFEFIMFFSIPVCFGLFLLAPEIILFFSGNQFTEAITCMKILSVLPFLLGIGYFFASQILIPGGRDKEVLFSTLAGLAVFVLLNFFLIPKFLQDGAAMANVISELVVTAGYLFFIKRHYTITINIYSVFKTAISCLVFVPIIYGLRLIHMPVFLAMSMSVLSCAATYVIIQWLIFKNETITYLYIFITAGLSKAMLKINK